MSYSRVQCAVRSAGSEPQTGEAPNAIQPD